MKFGYDWLLIKCLKLSYHERTESKVKAQFPEVWPLNTP